MESILQVFLIFVRLSSYSEGVDAAQRNKTISILKSINIPYILTDGSFNPPRIRQLEWTVRYWFNHVFTIRSKIEREKTLRY